jgi:hypothetical protein
LSAVVNDQLSADPFEYRAVSRGVGEREMPRRLSAARQVGGDKNKGLALQGFDCFGDGCVIIQRILRERADRQLRFSGCCRIAVIGLDKIKHIRRQPGVIDAVYGR